MLHEQKVGGILLEASVTNGEIGYVIVGVGVNLEAPKDVPEAAGLGENVGLLELLTAFLTRFARVYDAAVSLRRWSPCSWPRVGRSWPSSPGSAGGGRSTPARLGASVRGRLRAARPPAPPGSSPPTRRRPALDGAPASCSRP